MHYAKVICFNCHKSFLKSSRRVNESKKHGWKLLCSRECYILSRAKARTYKCTRTKCNKTFLRTPGQIRASKQYCSHSCAAIAININRPQKVRTCPNCGKLFTGFNKYCALKCIPHKTSKYTKTNIIQEIQSFIRKEKRIPFKQELIRINGPVRKLFGTWNNAILASGFEPNPVMFAKKYMAQDGHRCDSLAERIIDDFLSRRGVNHERNFPYPSNDGFTVDFKVGSYWIEFFGLSGELKRYDWLKSRKLKLAKKLKLNMLEIYPKHLFPKASLERILATVVKSHNFTP